MQETAAEDAPVRVLMKADPARQESLRAEAEVDPMDGEQTWPTEDELHDAEGRHEDDHRHNNVFISFIGDPLNPSHRSN